MIEGNSQLISYTIKMIIKLQGIIHVIPEILLVCFFWSELIVTDLYRLSHRIIPFSVQSSMHMHTRKMIPRE